MGKIHLTIKEYLLKFVGNENVKNFILQKYNSEKLSYCFYKVC